MKKPIVIEFKNSAGFVLQPVKRSLRNVRAALRMINDPSIMEFFCAIPRMPGDSLKAKATNAFIAVMSIHDLAKEPYNYLIVDKKKNKVAGCVALRPDPPGKGQPYDVSTLHISVAAFPEYRGRTLIREGARLVIGHVLQQDERVQMLDALIVPENVTSKTLAERAGMVHTETVHAPSTWQRMEDRTDVMRYTMTRQKALTLHL